jgi:hypothetical protein
LVNKAKVQERLSVDARPLTRRAERYATRAEVIVQSTHGDSVSARLNDISTYGCNVLTEAEWMRCGMFVSIALSAERTVQAIVRWVRGGSCGVEFLRPIPDAEADTLAAVWNR